ERAAAWARHLENEQALLEEEARAAVKARQAADQRVTRTNTILTEVRKRRERFHKLAGEKQCGHCGQPLHPEHVEVEEARLRKEQSDTEKSYQREEKARDRALRAEERLKKRLELAKLVLAEARDQAAEWQRRQRDAENGVRRAREECLLAYRELAE